MSIAFGPKESFVPQGQHCMRRLSLLLNIFLALEPMIKDMI
jgi:hypothetical protein